MKLIVRLRDYLDSTSRQALLERKAAEGQFVKDDLSQVPYTIYDMHKWHYSAGQRDVSLIRNLNREIMGDIITQQAAFYRYKTEETKVNMYGEAAGEKFFDGPFLFNCLLVDKIKNILKVNLG